MREILFRGKRVDNDEWIEGDLLQNIDCIKIREHEKSIKAIAKSFVVYPETVGQYTGLTDKNGNKIFEGDIVKFYDTIHKVVFETMNGTAYFGIKISDIETWGFGNYVEVYKLEVIGNIYDNPELLEDEE